MQGRIFDLDSLLELRLPEAAVDEQDFARLCERLGASGSTHETDAKSGAAHYVAWFPVGLDERFSRARITAAALLLGVDAPDISVTLLDDDWETAWQRGWHGMPVGERLWVRPSFCEAAPEGRIDIVLDPGMAFGTGQHATTQLCLRAIETICMQSPPASMLDMGCGSGILAIAAGKLGATGIVAIDNDPLSVEASGVNAGINGVDLEALLGDTPPAERFDLVVANILASPLIDMAPRLAEATGGRLLLSGLLERQIDDVRSAYEQAGLRFVKSELQDEWALLELERR